MLPKIKTNQRVRIFSVKSKTLKPENINIDSSFSYHSLIHHFHRYTQLFRHKSTSCGCTDFCRYTAIHLYGIWVGEG